MATINGQGNVIARCPNCDGALATFEWKSSTHAYGALEKDTAHQGWSHATVSYRLFRCGGCGRGSLGVVVFGGTHAYPGTFRELVRFTPETIESLKLPKNVPEGIRHEFREAEQCLASACNRAAAGMFRSVLDKTLRASGYKLKNGTSLEQQIDMAAKDGVITEARRKKAHEDIRVLGNDVLHDEWHEIKLEDVELAQHYAQRILEDLYDDRGSVLILLKNAGRAPDEDKITIENEGEVK
jgi:hypothetical protein